jgi:hypothetical protein
MSIFLEWGDILSKIKLSWILIRFSRMKGVYMNKFFIFAASLAFLAVAVPSYAQTTDNADAPAAADPAPAPAPDPTPDPTPAPTPAPVVAPSPSPVVSSEPAINRILREGVPLRVRQEQAFDANGDNRLDPNEVKAFLKSVYNETAQGPVKNTSDILYQFDKNKDGFIDRSEASAFSQYSF